MLEEFGDSLLDKGSALSEEQIRVLNCKLNNSFIRGLDKPQTLDLIWQKIKFLIENNNIFPRELLIVYEDKQDPEYLKIKIDENIEDKDAIKDIEFQEFKKFEEKYAPFTNRGTKTWKPMALKREKKIVFLIDPSLKKAKNFLGLMSKLFQENGAILFFWEYKKNLLNAFEINKNLPGVQIIDLFELNEQTISLNANTKSKNEYTLTHSIQETKNIAYKEIVQKIKKDQYYGVSYNSWKIIVPENENKETLQQVFTQIFNNEFEFFINWIKIIQLSRNNHPVDTKMFKQLQNWPYRNRDEFSKIMAQEEGLSDLWEFEIMGISEETNERWEMFLKIIQNINLFKGQETINEIKRKISEASNKVNHQLFEFQKNIQFPKIDKHDTPRISTFKQSDQEKEEFFQNYIEEEISDEKIQKRLKSYYGIIKHISKYQDMNMRFEWFRIDIPRSENKKVLEEVSYQILKKEFEFFICWINFIHNSEFSLQTEKIVIKKIKEWPYKNESNVFEFFNQIDKLNHTKSKLDLFEKIVIENIYRERWDWFLKTIEGISLYENSPTLFRDINEAVKKESKKIVTQQFKYKSSKYSYNPELFDLSALKIQNTDYEEELETSLVDLIIEKEKNFQEKIQKNSFEKQTSTPEEQTSYISNLFNEAPELTNQPEESKENLQNFLNNLMFTNDNLNKILEDIKIEEYLKNISFSKIHQTYFKELINKLQNKNLEQKEISELVNDFITMSYAKKTENEIHHIFKNLLSYTNNSQQETTSKNLGEISKQTLDNKNIHKKIEEYVQITKTIEHSQNLGFSYKEFKIKIPKNENINLIQKIFFKIVQNEFKYCINLVEIFHLNNKQKPISEKLCEEFFGWHQKDPKILKIIEKTKSGEKEKNLLPALEYLRDINPSYKEKWKEFLKLTENINLFEEDMVITKINSVIENYCKKNLNTFFQEENYLNFPTLNFLNDKHYDEKTEINKYKDIIKNIKLKQEKNYSYNDFRILVPINSQISVISKVFEEIFKNEFDNFIIEIRVNFWLNRSNPKFKETQLRNSSNINQTSKNKWKIFSKLTDGINMFEGEESIKKIDERLKKAAKKQFSRIFVFSNSTENLPKLESLIDKKFFAPEETQQNPYLLHKQFELTVFTNQKTEEIFQKRISKYNHLINKLKNYQKSGYSYKYFDFCVPMLEDKEVIEEIVFRIFKNEYQYFIDLLKKFRKNYERNKTMKSEDWWKFAQQTAVLEPNQEWKLKSFERITYGIKPLENNVLEEIDSKIKKESKEKINDFVRMQRCQEGYLQKSKSKIKMTVKYEHYKKNKPISIFFKSKIISLIID